MNKLESVKKRIIKEIGTHIECSEVRNSILMEGELDDWSSIVKAGYIGAEYDYRGVINDISLKGMEKEKINIPELRDTELQDKSYDVVVIGAGIIGSAIARELSKWNIKILIIDKEEDVAMQTSSRNDGMIHPGLTPKIGSKKSQYNIRGNFLYNRISKELGVKVDRCGSLVVFDKEYEKLIWPAIKRKANTAGVKGVRKIGRKELRNLEPNLYERCKWGVFIPTTGITSPYKMTIAYAENAVENGVDISLNTIVKGFVLEKGNIKIIRTNRGNIKSKIIINAAGVFADRIAEMAGDRFFTIHPRKGEIILLDKKKGDLINRPIGKLPLKIRKSRTKGGGILRTLEGNILIGPNAQEQPLREDYSTNHKSVNDLLSSHLGTIKGLNKSDVITYCAGIRASTYKEDFIVEKSENIRNLIYAAGIQSPGLASAPAIAEDIELMTIRELKSIQKVEKKRIWIKNRERRPRMDELSLDEKNKVIKRNKDYGTIICRCEGISRGEIIDCLNSPIKVNSVDAVKRRVRPGMGRCQGGFCMPLVMEIIEEYTKTPFDEITKKGKGSEITIGETKENRGGK